MNQQIHVINLLINVITRLKNAIVRREGYMAIGRKDEAVGVLVVLTAASLALSGA